MGNKINNANSEDFEKWVLGTTDVVSGHFKREKIAMLVLSHLFLLRLHTLSQEGVLPSSYNLQELGDIKLDSVEQVNKAMRLVNKSDISELDNIFMPIFGLFKNLDRGGKNRKVRRAFFMLLKERDYSIESFGEDKFGQIFSELANHFLSDPHVGGEHVSTSLAQSLFSNISLSKGKDRILDPTFGIGNTVIQLIRNQKDKFSGDLVGYEINDLVHSYGRMNLLMNGIYSFDLHLRNALEKDWCGKFDLIIADPPIGLRTNEMYLGDRSTKELNPDLILKSTEYLKPDGRLCFITGDHILTANRMRKFRKELIDSGYLKRVISLPGNKFKGNTNIPLNLVVLENRKTSKEVELYNYRNFEEVNFQKQLKERDWMFKSFELPEVNNPSRIKFIDQDDFTLLPKKYAGSIHHEVKELHQENRAIKLHKILERKIGHKPEGDILEQLSNKLIKIQDLKDDPFDPELNSIDYETDHEIPSNKSGIKIIEESVLLIANRGENLKPTYLDSSGSPVLIDQSIEAFKILPGKVTREYLFYQLHTDFFERQLSAMRTGSTIPYISYKDFLNLSLPLPEGNKYDYRIAQENFLDKKRQEAFEKAYQRRKKETEELKKKLNIVKHEESLFRDIEEEELIEYMNHNVRNKLSPVKDSLDLLHEFMRKNKGDEIDLNALEGEPLEGEDESDLNTINDLFLMAKKGLDNAFESLKRLEDFRLNEYKPEDFQKVNLFEWLKKDLESRNTFYSIELVTKEDNPEDVFNMKIVKSAFRDLIENLLENAEKHGFKHDLENYTALFEFSLEGNSIVIDYKNDGEPLRDNLNKEKFISRGGKAGNKQGNGYGGFFIHRTIRKHGGNFKIMKTTKKSSYNVHFKFIIPKNLKD